MNGQAFAYLELKPFPRYNAPKLNIRFEETAEMAAIIYQEAVQVRS